MATFDSRGMVRELGDMTLGPGLEGPEHVLDHGHKRMWCRWSRSEGGVIVAVQSSDPLVHVGVDGTSTVDVR